MLWLVGAALLVVVGIAAWNYPRITSRIAERRRAAGFRMLAGELGLDFTEPSAVADAGFLPTVQSIFGPYGDLRHVLVRREHDGETTYLFEYLFGARPGASYKHGVAIVAVRLAKPVPMFTLCKPRGPARSRTTEHGARGQRLLVQAIEDLELWSLKGERKRARTLVTPLVPALDGDPGWNIRGIDEWLVLFNETRQDDLSRFYARAQELRRLLRT